jgi:PelA/Pel-15E family pectate lyase
MIDAGSLSGMPDAPSPPAKEQVLTAMKQASRFMVEKVGYRGAYVWAYLPDLSRRWGELEAYPTMGWVQNPGTPSMGHLFLDAYHATGDEYYYDAACETARALIWAQLPCGGWNYMFDYAGEHSLKRWYATIGKQAWRMEEFHHYYDNATFDDGGTVAAAELLLRIYVEKNDPAFRPPLEKTIRLIVESQYPSGGWPQRYPPRYDPTTLGNPDYPSCITLNDDVSMRNIDFLLQCYQSLGWKNVREPITRAMNILIALQHGAPCAGWADQYTVDELKPAPARSYEPCAINTGTTVEMIYLMMEYYRLTGETKFLSGLPAAIDFLASLQLPDDEVKRAGKTLRRPDDILIPRYIDPKTGLPQYIHRKGSNVANGCYYFDQDIRHTVSHIGSTAAVNIGELRRALAECRKTPNDSLLKRSPLFNGRPLRKYYSAPFRSTTANLPDAATIIDRLDPAGYWPTPLPMISAPYKACPPLPPSEDDTYAQTRAGDEYDTSTRPPETPVDGVHTAVYIANMMTLIHYLNNE